MNDKFNSNYVLLLTTLIMMWTFFPVIYALLPGSFYHIFTLVWGLSLFKLAPAVYKDKLMIAVYILGFYLFFMMNTFCSEMDDWNRANIWTDYYSMIIAISVFLYYKYTKDYVSYAKLAKYTCSFIIFGVIWTIIYTSINPSVTRDGLAENGINVTNVVGKYGLASRGDGFGYIGLLSILIYYFKMKIYDKKLLVGIVLIMLLGLYKLQFTTLLLFGMGMLLVSFISTKNRAKTLSIIAFTSLILIFIPQHAYVSLFNGAGELFGETSSLGTRIYDIGSFIEYGGEEIDNNAVSSRINVRYESIFEEFANSPIFGSFFMRESQISGKSLRGEAHLFLANKLLITGLVGFFLWLSIFYIFIKNVVLKYNFYFQYYMLVVIIGILAYGLVKVIISRQAWAFIFVVLPGMYYLPLLSKKSIKPQSRNKAIIYK